MRASVFVAVVSLAATTVALVPGCGESSEVSSGAPAAPATGTPTSEPPADAAPPASDAAVDAGPTPTGQCASTFGDALQEGFGRIDGVVYAVQKPSDTQCVMPNADHLVLQVLMNGAVYRMVVNVMSDRAGQSPDVRYAKLPHALVGPTWSEGWHLDAPLDYVTSLAASSMTSGFAAKPMDALVTTLAAELTVGAKVSVYATSGNGRPESAHLVHRNKTDKDGAIVVSPTTSPSFLLFHFDGQVF